MPSTKQWTSKIFRQKVLTVTIIYLCFSWGISLYNRSLLYSEWYEQPVQTLDPWIEFIIATVIGLVAGIVGGSFLISIYERVFKTKSFGYSWALTFVFFVAIFLIIVVLINVILLVSRLNDNESFSETLTYTLETALSPTLISTFFLWSLVIVLTVFFLQINDKFGPGILRKFIRGDYHRPKLEDRLFMFLDMRSSTVIAEQLGNTAYFNLLQEVFLDLTDPIIAHRGEIYQYVGDEIVISWKLDNEEAPKWAIQCFFAIQSKLLELADTYESKHGVRPEFKAGIHHGTVTAGEIGSIKKDIVYSGDVLNTTARIQEQCNAFKVDIILSEATKKLVDTGKLVFRELGVIELRGKEEKVGLFTVSLN